MVNGKMMSKDLNILYEDNHIIVVEKPCNILSQGDSTKDISLLDMVKEYIKNKYKKPGNVYLGLVHRLDRPVGGLMVFARSSKASSRLMKSFQQHLVDKRYLAIVNGKMEKEKDEFIDFIEKGKDGNSFISVTGKKAVLDYEVLSYLKEKNCSLVSIRLKTGRHHQIRIQFASRGHFILGDQRYGIVDYKQISLFCYYLSFTHPITKEIMKFQLEMPHYDYWTLFTM